MLLQLDNSDIEGLRKLLLFAKQNSIALNKVSTNISTLSGKPYTNEELESLVLKSRQSGKISGDKASEEIKRLYGN